MIRIVLGNESSDLDSTISACVYAYFLHSMCVNQNEVLTIPIMNTNSAKFRLHTEVRWFLGDNSSNVIFINDINLNELYHQNKLEIVLVDHHYLDSELNNAVIEIIDHHTIKKNSIVLQDSSAIKIEPVGSCCTLIAEKLLTSNFEMTDEIASLLTGPILFDTINFSPEAGKATVKDQEIYAQLQAFRYSYTDDCELYTKLRNSASDVSGLSMQDLLLKDAKHIVTPNIRLIMSSLPNNYTVQEFIGKVNTINDLNEFLLQNENADGIIFTSLCVEDNETKRQLGFYMRKSEHLQAIDACLHKSELNLGLEEQSLPVDQAPIKFFEQSNAKASRKKILPFIESYIEDFIVVTDL